jgi:hypothetical protein
MHTSVQQTATTPIELHAFWQGLRWETTRLHASAVLDLSSTPRTNEQNKTIDPILDCGRIMDLYHRKFSRNQCIYHVTFISDLAARNLQVGSWVDLPRITFSLLFYSLLARAA